ncbi:MAG: phage tail protein [Lachnospiraceae bacterium]|nr:phage tail protein [Lachnospiraceae bacterium]
MDAIYLITPEGEKKLLCSTAGMKRVMSFHELNLQLNQPGEMKMRIPVENPMLQDIAYLADEITFERNEIELFRGEAKQDEEDILNTGEITVEGALGYLRAVHMEPYEYSGTVLGYVTMLLDWYNAHVSPNRQIQIGSVTVTDPNDYITRSDSDWVTILSLLEEKLVDKLGGYLRIRVLDGIRYLDYLADFGRVSTQKIAYGKNLISVNQIRKYDEVYTVLIPLGAENEETGERLTVESVNYGSIYVVNEDARTRYGWRECVIKFDDVTLPENLLSKAQALSESYAGIVKTLEITAVDLSLFGRDVDCFYLGDMIRVESLPHDIDTTMMLSQMTLRALDPENERLNLGNVRQTFTESTRQNIRDMNSEISTSKKNNWNLAERIRNAQGLYSTEETGADGAKKLYLHNKPELNDSMVIISVSEEGIFTSGDGGATWYGQEIDGDTILRWIEATGISADVIYGGMLSSIAKDKNDMPVTYIDMDKGEVAKFGNIAWVKRDSGNESLKWMGET